MSFTNDIPSLLATYFYDNWTQTLPLKDQATPLTTDSTGIYFTPRYFRYAPIGIHTNQISVQAPQELSSGLNMGNPTKYEVRLLIPIHIWTLATTKDTIEDAYTRMRNIIEEIARIIKANPTGIIGIQYLMATPGVTPQDEFGTETEVALGPGGLRLHRVFRATGIFYRVT